MDIKNTIHENEKLTLSPYAMALVTGWSRVHARAHYWHDVLGGAAVSALFTWLLVGKYDNNVTVAADGDGFKLGFRMQF